MCFSLIKNAQMLCKRFVHQIQRVFGIPGEISENETYSDLNVSQRATDRIMLNDTNSDDY